MQRETLESGKYRLTADSGAVYRINRQEDGTWSWQKENSTRGGDGFETLKAAQEAVEECERESDAPSPPTERTPKPSPPPQREGNDEDLVEAARRRRLFPDATFDEDIEAFTQARGVAGLTRLIYGGDDERAD